MESPFDAVTTARIEQWRGFRVQAQGNAKSVGYFFDERGSEQSNGFNLALTIVGLTQN